MRLGTTGKADQPPRESVTHAACDAVVEAILQSNLRNLSRGDSGRAMVNVVLVGGEDKAPTLKPAHRAALGT